jgi:hypothetical protein
VAVSELNGSLPGMPEAAHVNTKSQAEHPEANFCDEILVLVCDKGHEIKQKHVQITNHNLFNHMEKERTGNKSKRGK